MPEMKVEFEVFCAACGDGLCAETDVTYGRHGNIKLKIRPCSQCDERAYDRGFLNGEKSQEA